MASGRGGDGCVSFRRGKHMPRGGPDGGDGGRGGALILVATANRNTLADFRWNKLYQATHGSPGTGGHKKGQSAESLILEVPVGTVIIDEETEEQLSDLHTEGFRWTIPGGNGGLGNVHFATPTYRTPDVATEGAAATQRAVRLELRLIADIGLVGFPNAGKSTLIGQFTAARPKVADYAFTTLYPVLGVVDLGDDSRIVIADLPGLIEGASDGAGLGHRFLKHVQRCAALVHLVSIDAEEGVIARWESIRREIAQWEGDLSDRPEIVVLSRCDLVEPEQVGQARAALATHTGADVLPISSTTGEGIDALRARIIELFKQAALAESRQEAP